MHCNKKVEAMSHRLHPPWQKSCGRPWYRLCLKLMLLCFGDQAAL